MTSFLDHTLHTEFLSDNISSLRKLVKFDTQEQIINKASRARDLAKLECIFLFTENIPYFREYFPSLNSFLP